MEAIWPVMHGFLHASVCAQICGIPGDASPQVTSGVEIASTISLCLCEAPKEAGRIQSTLELFLLNIVESAAGGAACEYRTVASGPLKTYNINRDLCPNKSGIENQ